MKTQHTHHRLGCALSSLVTRVFAFSQRTSGAVFWIIRPSRSRASFMRFFFRPMLSSRHDECRSVRSNGDLYEIRSTKQATR